MQYVGFTIGPIFETVNDATTPAALWFASTMFSDITRRLCILIKENIPDAVIYSPFFDEADQEGLRDGVGKYHDRVIFSAGMIDEDILKQMVWQVKRETIHVFGKEFLNPKEQEEAIAFFEEYLMIVYVVLDENEMSGNNCILEISPYLDALELMHFSKGDKYFDPINKLFRGKEGGRNTYLKESRLISLVQDSARGNLLDESGSIKSIETIAGVVSTPAAETLKFTNYFAVINADGDGMGAFLQTLNNDQIVHFSKACLEYDKAATQKIAAYGGMPIYAGGDDLLFLAPVVGQRHTFLKLCHEINELFHETIAQVEQFKDNPCIPTISFGVSIQYYKYPLYEALNRARNQLHVAKDVSEGERKNRLSMIMEKHSGQIVDCIIGNEHLLRFEEVVMEPYNMQKRNELDAVLKSLGITLARNQELLKVIDRNVLETGLCMEDREHFPWDNLFDNEGQADMKDYLRYIQKWYYDEVLGKERWRLYSNGGGNALEATLRLSKFLIERGQVDD